MRLGEYCTRRPAMIDRKRTEVNLIDRRGSDNFNSTGCTFCDEKWTSPRHRPHDVSCLCLPSHAHTHKCPVSTPFNRIRAHAFAPLAFAMSATPKSFPIIDQPLVFLESSTTHHLLSTNIRNHGFNPVESFSLQAFDTAIRLSLRLGHLPP